MLTIYNLKQILKILTIKGDSIMVDWTHLLGWSSPIGLGAFLFGLGAVLRGLKKMHGHWDKK